MFPKVIDVYGQIREKTGREEAMVEVTFYHFSITFQKGFLYSLHNSGFSTPSPLQGCNTTGWL